MDKKTKILVVFVIIGAVVFISYMSLAGLSFENKESDFFYVPVVTGDNISAYKNSCAELNLSQVSKDPFSLVGKKVKLTGQIYKKEYTDFEEARTFMVIKVPDFSPEYYILLFYSSNIPFKEGDMITVYGEYYYPAQTDVIPEIANMQLSVIKAGYIEKA